MHEQSGIPRNNLLIGAYILRPYARTPQHIQDIAACGIDCIVCMDMDRAALDLFQENGIGAIVSGVVPSWWGGDGENAGTLSVKNPLSAYDKGRAEFKDHPAIWGIDIGDEPSKLDLEAYGAIYQRVKCLFPGKFPYLNLYPNYASVASNSEGQTLNQLGCKTYEEYIRAYCEYVPVDYLCYDYYCYSASITGAYENLRIVSQACRQSARSMWIVLQVNSHNDTYLLTENQLRFQAYTAMAFGAEVITWACYTAGWWQNNVLDELGNKTAQYDKLQKINAELHALGRDYMLYRNVATYFVGFSHTPWMQDVHQDSPDILNVGYCLNVHATRQNGEPLPVLVGDMVHKDQNARHALFIAVCDDPYDSSAGTGTLCCSLPEGQSAVITSSDGDRSDPVSGQDITFPIHSNRGYLLQLM